MTADPLFARAEQVISESHLLKDERRRIHDRFSDTRKELRLAVLAMARLRAEVDEERKRQIQLCKATLSAWRGRSPL